MRIININHLLYKDIGGKVDIIICCHDCRITRLINFSLVPMVLFLTHLILKKKNSLSKIWLAAHWDKKLTRYHIHQIDIESSVKDIMCKEIILDLRLSGHLLVGIVKIFSRKTKYLLNECSEIFNKVTIFRTSKIDISPTKLRAGCNNITLPEMLGKFEDIDFEKINEDDIFQSNQSQIEEITLKETVGDAHLFADDDFENFDEANIPINFDDNNQLMSLFEDDAIQEVKKNEYCSDVEMKDGSSNSFEGILEQEATLHISESHELIPIFTSIEISKQIEKIELNLEPLSGAVKNFQRIKRHKRKLIIDEVKTLSREKVEKQIKVSSDVVIPLDLAPPSKRLMILKEIGGAEKLLHQPGEKIGGYEIQNVFKRNLKTFKTEETVNESSEEDTSIKPDFFQGNLDVNKTSLANEVSDSEELFNGNIFNENVANSDSSTNEMGCIQEQNETLTNKMDFSNQFQHDISSGNTSDNARKILQERIIKLLHILNLSFKETNEIKFSVLVQGYRKMKVCQKFLSLLMLKKFGIIELQQEKPYGEILITKGTNLESAYEDLYHNT
ncbi:double-strand-break repair protein rad21 homolog [Trichonephila clavipes]|nr:double-strand-break repair protein rad21 homolog [Trichonephila clavipes]